MLYKQNTSDTPPKSRLSFIQDIVASLAEEHMLHRQRNRARRRQASELQRIPEVSQSQKMKFEEGTVTSDTMETIIRVLTQNGFRFGDSKNCLDIAFNDIDVPNENIERSAFPGMLYKLYDIPGNSSVAIKVNQMIWPTSMKRVSFPSAVVKTSHCRPEARLSHASSILGATRATSKMQTSKFLTTNRISTGTAVVRSSGSTWMTHAQNSSSKAFPNFRHFVFDASIMKLEDNEVEQILSGNKELSRIIESATQKTGIDRGRMKDDINISEAGNQNKTENEKHTTTANNDRSDLDTDNNLNFVPKRPEVGKHEKNVLECGHRGPEAFSCKPLTYNNNGGIEDKVDEIMRYQGKSSSNIFQKHENEVKISKANIDIGTLTDSAADHVVNTDETEDMQDTIPTDSCFVTVDFKKVEAECSLNNYGGKPAGEYTHNNELLSSTDQTDATVVPLDESPDFGEDSSFGILGIYCSSRIHSWYGKELEAGVYSVDENDKSILFLE